MLGREGALIRRSPVAVGILWRPQSTLWKHRTFHVSHLRQFFETFFDLARGGRFNPKTKEPSFRQLALLLNDFRGDTPRHTATKKIPKRELAIVRRDGSGRMSGYASRQALITLCARHLRREL